MESDIEISSTYKGLTLALPHILALYLNIAHVETLSRLVSELAGAYCLHVTKPVEQYCKANPINRNEFTRPPSPAANAYSLASASIIEFIAINLTRLTNRCLTYSKD
jgi:hypothetical protein